MNFFDSVIRETKNLLEPFAGRTVAYDEKNVWADAGQNQVILQRDTLAEVDGVGFNLITTEKIQDETVVIGKDIFNLKGKIPFARIAFIELDPTADEQKAYNLIKKIEYTKYHTFPDGYMARTASRSHREAVRISKKAVSDGIDFHKVGNLYIKKYKENPAVKGVKIVFITDENVDYTLLQSLAVKNSDITRALNHVMNSVNFDCDSCNLKPVCDEVEGMRELHFKKFV